MKLKRICAAFLTVCMIVNLSGCAEEIDYPEDFTPAEKETSAAEPVEPAETAETLYNESKLLNYDIINREFYEKYQIEDAEGQTVYSALSGYEGRGYVQLDEDMTVTVSVDVPVSQHYRIGLNLCSTGGKILLSVNDTPQDAYYIEDAVSFSAFYLNHIYLRTGINRLQFKGLEGIIYLDYATAANTELLPEERFSVSSLLVNKNADNKTKDVMMYLSGIFGKYTLTGQHCTINSNAEINAIYAVTGRYPALRCGDLANYSRYYGGGDKKDNRELELAEAWAEKGGLVSFSWSWYSPVNGNSHYLAAETDFDLDGAYTTRDIALLDINQLEAYYESGIISEACLEIVRDIDEMAENLKQLRDKGITVLWRPLYEASVKWYWWGDCLPRSYVWLWKLMVDRMSSLHGLSNLIWVWNGEDNNYYPGDGYVDIIGEDVYNKGDTSNISRFASTTRYGVRRKAAAMTECGLVPNPDVLFRDNARWLWFALYRGDYLVDDSGFYRGGINTKERLNHAYNHEKTITLDELAVIYQ